MKPKSIIIVDDHQLISDSLKRLIDSFGDYQVIEQLKNGFELTKYLRNKPNPDLILLDVKMPVMDGKETMKWLRENHPSQNTLILSVENCEATIIFMIRHGAKGYILKDIGIQKFRTAIDSVLYDGFYHNELVGKALIGEITHKENLNNLFSERELSFLEFVCTDMTYKEIATKMFLSPKTIDGYRENLFKKIGAKNRIGLAIYAIKNGLVKI